MSDMSFSCGFSFFYWPWFDKEVVRKGDEYDFYTSRQLFIKSGKYKNMKAEIILNDNEVGPKIWNENVVNKAEEYINTKKVKSLRFKRNSWNKYFGINNGAIITIEHLKSLILYTDFSKLSTNFTKTFRKLYESEALESVKSRNANYYNMARLLIETVQRFGYYGRNSAAFEDVYCSMDCKLIMGSFRIKFRGPLSTSIHIEIAQNFAKRRSYFGLSHWNEKRFNVSWLSGYRRNKKGY